MPQRRKVQFEEQIDTGKAEDAVDSVRQEFEEEYAETVGKNISL